MKLDSNITITLSRATLPVGAKSLILMIYAGGMTGGAMLSPKEARALIDEFAATLRETEEKEVAAEFEALQRRVAK